MWNSCPARRPSGPPITHGRSGREIFRTDYGHEEAVARFGQDPRVFALVSKEFHRRRPGQRRRRSSRRSRLDQADRVGPLRGDCQVREQTIGADLVLLAMGFLGPEQAMTDLLGVAYDPRGNYLAEHGRFDTAVPGVFAAGDCRRGQSLVVWAINEGRGAARAIDQFLMGTTALPASGIAMATSDSGGCQR